MINNLRHVGLVVVDLEGALAFWCEVMGFQILRSMDEFGQDIDAMLDLEDVRLKTVKLVDSNGSLLEILKFYSHIDSLSWSGTPFSTGLTHLALTVESIDLLLEKFKKIGLDSNATPQISKDGLVKVVYVKGPEGLLLELVENISHD